MESLDKNRHDRLKEVEQHAKANGIGKISKPEYKIKEKPG